MSQRSTQPPQVDLDPTPTGRRVAWGGLGIVPLVAVLVWGVLWLGALQETIAASDVTPPRSFRINYRHLEAEAASVVGPLMDDSGEFLVAWHTWGVTHPPGYPLLNLVANVITGALDGVRVPPVPAAAAVSFVTSLGALVFLAAIVKRVAGGPAAAYSVCLAAGGPLTWLYAAVPEVYGLGLLLAMATLWTALRLGEFPTARGAIGLGLLVGLTVGHHRTLAMLLPGLLVAVWPARHLRARVWLMAALAAVASLGVYLYLPLAAAAGSPWVYGRDPRTWAGLLDSLLAREYVGDAALPVTFGALLREVRLRVTFGDHEVVAFPAVAMFVIIGLANRVPLAVRTGVCLILVLAAYMAAPVGNALLVGTHLPVMLAAWAAAGLMGVGLGVAAERAREWGRSGMDMDAIVVVMATFVTAYAAYFVGPGVKTYTGDDYGSRLVAAAASLPPHSVSLVEDWSPRYFALAAGKLVTGELAEHRLLQTGPALDALPAPESLSLPIVTTHDILHVIPPADWAAWAGTDVVMTAAGGGLVALGPRSARGWPQVQMALIPSPAARDAARTGSEAPPSDTEPPAPPIRLEALTGRAEGGVLELNLWWVTLRQPDKDYHVYVHVTSEPLAVVPGHILAQSDRTHPVYGFFPTSLWRTGDKVRDDYRLKVESDRARFIAVGLYEILPDGAFRNLTRTVIPYPIESTGARAR